MRRVLLALLILILPSAIALTVYFLVRPRVIPTSRDAVGKVATLAGTGAPGAEDGPQLSAAFSDPFGITIDRRGNILVADGGQNNRIRKITPDGKVQTIAGSAEGFADGSAPAAQFNTPSG